MNRRPKRLPPLSALRGFEAAARLGSFSKAASELHMTQSAISHQIKLLEEFFDQPLFKRINRAVELTDAGADFLDTTTQSLDILAQGSYRLEFYKKPGSVVLTTTPAFAAKWLIHRLPNLREQHPVIDPWIHTTDEQDSLEHSEVDIGIWYGDGDWPGLETVKLFDDAVTPLYSPDMPVRGKAIETPADLRNQVLIHVEQVERREDWRSWFSLAEVEETDTVTGLNLSDTGLALECAASGQGIVLGSKILAADLIESGKLLQPFDLAVPTEQNYYLVSTKEKLQQPEVLQMFNWIAEQSEAES